MEKKKKPGNRNFKNPIDLVLEKPGRKNFILFYLLNLNFTRKSQWAKLSFFQLNWTGEKYIKVNQV